MMFPRCMIQKCLFMFHDIHCVQYERDIKVKSYLRWRTSTIGKGNIDKGCRQHTSFIIVPLINYSRINWGLVNVAQSVGEPNYRMEYEEKYGVTKQ